MIYDYLENLGVDISQEFKIVYSDGQSEIHDLECANWNDLVGGRVETKEGLIFEVISEAPYLRLLAC